jgi:hypothetical protein
VLIRYSNQRKKEHSAQLDTPFFVSRFGKGMTRRAAEAIFSQLRRHARVQRYDGGRFQPRLHDLRQHADSPIMPTVAKWLSARFVCGCVPHFADKLNSA